jgi:hypothetical protein
MNPQLVVKVSVSREEADGVREMKKQYPVLK